jgi:excisionase family DNA binding protein
LHFYHDNDENSKPTWQHDAAALPGGIPMTTPQTMTPQEVARALEVSLKRVYDLLHEGRLAASKIDGKWAVARDAVEARRKLRG